MLDGGNLQITLGSHSPRGGRNTGEFCIMEAKGRACFKKKRGTVRRSDRSCMMGTGISVEFSKRSHLIEGFKQLLWGS